MSLIPAQVQDQSIKQAARQVSLGSEENQKQKTGKDMIEERGHIPFPTSSRTWQLWPLGSALEIYKGGYEVPSMTKESHRD